MHKQKEKYKREIETVCVWTIIVMNLLLLAALGQTIWLAHSIFYNEEIFQSMIFDNFLP